MKTKEEILKKIKDYIETRDYLADLLAHTKVNRKVKKATLGIIKQLNSKIVALWWVIEEEE